MKSTTESRYTGTTFYHDTLSLQSAVSVGEMVADKLSDSFEDLDIEDCYGGQMFQVTILVRRVW